MNAATRDPRAKNHQDFQIRIVERKAYQNVTTNKDYNPFILLIFKMNEINSL